MAYCRAAMILVALFVYVCAVAPAQLVAARLRRPGAAAPTRLCRLLSRLLGVEIVVEGALQSGRPLLLAANHVSWIDIIALSSVAPICFLAKREVGAWPIVGALARMQGAIFVDRQRRRSIPPANAQMAWRMLEGRAVALFPEGTTGDGRALGAFRSSHFASARDLLAAAPEVSRTLVQPVALSYSSPDAPWVGDASLLPHVWRVLRLGGMRCRIVFGEPLSYARDADRKQVAKETQACVAAMLGLDAPARQSAAPSGRVAA